MVASVEVAAQAEVALDLRPEQKVFKNFLFERKA